MTVAEVGLDRPERTWARGPVNGCQTSELNGVADWRAGAVRLDHADGDRIDAAGRESRPIHRDLGIA